MVAKMSDAKMIELCDCGKQFTVIGVDREKYNHWKKFGRESLAATFPALSTQHHDQLIESQCCGCYEKTWGSL
ncbi:hypothetical protein OAV22_02035 [Flavobacteriaceae bacterium]|nr:hypothetical protein [Flavobacteriaceae bacterium]